MDDDDGFVQCILGIYIYIHASYSTVHEKVSRSIARQVCTCTIDSSTSSDDSGFDRNLKRRKEKKKLQNRTSALVAHSALILYCCQGRIRKRPVAAAVRATTPYTTTTNIIRVVLLHFTRTFVSVFYLFFSLFFPPYNSRIPRVRERV